MKTNLFNMLCLLALTCACGGGGSDSSSNSSATVRISGRVSVPANAVSAGTPTALANAAVSIDDLSGSSLASKSLQREIPTVNTTDEDGNYDVVVDRQPILAIIVRGEIDGRAIRISGLVRVDDSSEVTKDLSAESDLAAQALSEAVSTGSTSFSQTSLSRIEQLEQAAQNYLDSNNVDFLDPESVRQAATALADSFDFSDAPSTSEPDTVDDSSNGDFLDKIISGGFDATPGAYAAEGGGCGIGTFSISGDNGVSITVSGFGDNPTIDFTIENSTRASADGLTIFNAAAHVCTFISNLFAGTIQVSCTNDSGGSCSQTNRLQCASGTTSCGDGTIICAEQVCNTVRDCEDGSDEAPDVCGDASSCCQATSGCPGETGSSCTDSCCCCPLGSVCDQGSFASGCVPVQ